MPVINFVALESWKGEPKQINLVHPDASALEKKFETTILTGQNGSYKSSLLKQLASELIVSAEKSGKLSSSKQTPQAPCYVICVSGSPSDRFPQKEKPGGGRTLFDVPNYAYFGQRIYANILSKKFPLETLLTFALAPSKSDRYGWNFFSESHRIVDIDSEVEYTLRTDPPSKKGILNILSAKTPDDSKEYRKGEQLESISYPLAKWFLSEFTVEEFEQLDNVLERARVRISVKINSKGPYCERITPNVVRLGLMLDVIKLIDATVCRARTNSKFSIFELSSGEYHLFTTILGIGFSVEESSILLIDEPENNLHPQWQRALMAMIFEVCDSVLDNGHLIVSTHSPLIVGSAVQGSTIVDLTDEEPTLSLASYGASSDQLLLNQFGVGSSRNKLVVDTVQRAISLVESDGLDSAEFTSLIPALKNIREALLDTDPLTDVINVLLDEEIA